MDLVVAGSKQGKVRHFIDADRYSQGKRRKLYDPK